MEGLILDSPCTCHWPVELVPSVAWKILSDKIPTLEPANRVLTNCDCCSPGASAQSVRESVWLDPFDLVRCIDVPLVVVNGTNDEMCPPLQVEAFFEQATTTEKKLVWIQGKGHNEVTGTRKYWQTLTQFIEQVATKAQDRSADQPLE